MMTSVPLHGAALGAVDKAEAIPARNEQRADAIEASRTAWDEPRSRGGR